QSSHDLLIRERTFHSENLVGRLAIPAGIDEERTRQSVEVLLLVVVQDDRDQNGPRILHLSGPGRRGIRPPRRPGADQHGTYEGETFHGSSSNLKPSPILSPLPQKMIA